MKHLVIGIAGGTGSGKTTLTRRVVAQLDPASVVVIQHDSYYKDIALYGGITPEEVNFDHPDALETDLFVEHLRELKKGHSVDIPVYDFTTHHRQPLRRTVDPKEIVIVDGILIFADRRLRELMDVRLFVDADADERLIRRIERDMSERGRSIASVIDQYRRTVKPMHEQFVEPSKQWADIIIPRGGENAVASEMVVTRIHTMLGALAVP